MPPVSACLTSYLTPAWSPLPPSPPNPLPRARRLAQGGAARRRLSLAPLRCGRRRHAPARGLTPANATSSESGTWPKSRRMKRPRHTTPSSSLNWMRPSSVTHSVMNRCSSESCVPQRFPNAQRWRQRRRHESLLRRRSPTTTRLRLGSQRHRRTRRRLSRRWFRYRSPRRRRHRRRFLAREGQSPDPRPRP